MPQDTSKDSAIASLPVEKIPSNDEVISKIDKEIHRLDKVEHKEDIDVGYRTERVLEDAKTILKDAEVIVAEKNPDDNVQKLLKDGYYLAVELANDERFGSLFDNWGAILASVAKSGDWTEITKAAGSLAHDLRDTESFIALLNELQTTFKLLLSQKVDQVSSSAESAAKKVVEGVEDAAKIGKNAGIIQEGEKTGELKDKAENIAEKAADKTEDLAAKARDAVHSSTGVSSSSKPISEEKYKHKLEKQRAKLLQQLNVTLNALNSNPTWRMMLAKAKHTGKTIQKEGLEPTADLLVSIKENPRTAQLITDVQNTLQGLVGDQFSVEPFFKHSEALLKSILEDNTYVELLEQAQDQLTFLAKNPERIDDQYTQDNLKSLWAKLEAKLEALNNNPDLIAARREGQKLIKVLENDPTAARLVGDTKKLVRHLNSIKPGQLLDPKLLAEMRSVIVPLLLEHLKDVPVPSIQDVQDTPIGKYDYTLENIHINAKSLVPDNVHLKFKYDLDAHPLTLTANKQHLVVVLEATDIQVHLKDVEWKYERLTTPHLSDSGKADLQTGGKGITIRLKMEVNALNDTHTTATGHTIHNKNVLTVLESKATVDRWHVTFSDSKHDKLYEFLSGVYSGRITKQVEELLVTKMSNFADTFNHKVYVMYNEAMIKAEEVATWAEARRATDMTKVWSNAKHSIEGARDKVKDAVDVPVSAAKEFAYEKGKEALKIGFERAKDGDIPNIGAAVGELAKGAQEALGGIDVVGAIRGKAGEAAGKVSEVAGKVSEKAGEAAEVLSEKAEEVADKAGEVAKKAGDKASDLADKAGDAAKKAGDKASDAAKKAGDKASDLADKAGDAAKKAGDKVADAAEDAGKKDYVRVPLSARDYAPVPASTFVSADPDEKSTLGDVPNTAKYPISVMQPASVTVIEKIPKSEN